MFIDAGGTFTDCLALDPRDRLHRAKVLSTGAVRGVVLRRESDTRWRVELPGAERPGLLRGMTLRPAGEAGVVVSDHPEPGVVVLDRPMAVRQGARVECGTGEEAPILAMRLVTGTPAGSPLPPAQVVLATTRGTNALLERRGGKVALFVTAGFADLLRIGTQQRPDLFALDIRKPDPVADLVLEVPGRLDAAGRVLHPLDVEALRTAAARARSAGCDVAAVALMHAWRDASHERQAEAVLAEAGFAHVSVSSSLAPTIGYLERATTAAVDAYLAPVLGSYLRRIAGAVPRGSVHVMTSAGGLCRAEAFHAKDSLLSGPAGGVAGAAWAARTCGLDRVISFDMGGTSTDVARCDGAFAYRFEHTVGHATVAAPALGIHTVAAGGGSVCWADRGALAVGPHSAGADPGPACYGRGGPLTLTDVNLLLGRIDPGTMSVPVDRGAAEHAARNLARLAGRDDLPRMLADLLDIANERMAEAIRQISVREGYDPAAYALVAFGGAGGQHACDVARRLGISRVVVPPDAGLLSAAGLAWSGPQRVAERQVLRTLQDADLPALIERLQRQARQTLQAEEGIDPDAASLRNVLGLRRTGQHAVLHLDWSPHIDVRQRFVERYRATYGHSPPSPCGIEVESVRVIATGPAWADLRGAGNEDMEDGQAPAVGVARSTLRAGEVVRGPELIVERHAATWVPQGWSARVHPSGALLLRADRARPGARRSMTDEVFQARLEAVAKEMGELLRRTALSVNVKDRLDFSCAVLDASGRLIVNAPHVPVHLGALGVCVRAVASALPMGPGDTAVTNHPAFGGSHLPDLTVITPVFAGGDRPIAYLASRAHHAEIGGIVPGSLSPDATCLAMEGCVIPPMHLTRAGTSEIDRVRDLLRAGPYPSRRVEENLADLLAAEAANSAGRRRLEELVASQGAHRFCEGLECILARAEDLLARSLPAALDAQAADALDDGSPIRARCRIERGRVRLEIEGPGHHPGPYNTPLAVVHSVVVYALRLLVGEPIPLNEGLMRRVDLAVRPGMLNPAFTDDPHTCPAVGAGNVETSQRIADVLVRLFDLAAASQGTMNNVVIGNDRFSLYETIGGGAGAGPAFDGCSAVHTHMTNTRITDAEIMEHRWPVRVERFALRAGSGGAGRFRGGDGVVRHLRLLERATVSVLAQRRAAGPPGAHGGMPGSPGAQWLVRADGSAAPLTSTTPADAGDLLVIHTPGGGGWG